VTIAPPAPPSPAGGTEPALRRALGRWDLTAIGINQVIGAAVFAQPALLAAHAGAWSPWMVAAVGVASMLIALSFAEVGSRFEGDTERHPVKIIPPGSIGAQVGGQGPHDSILFLLTCKFYLHTLISSCLSRKRFKNIFKSFHDEISVYK